MEALRRQIAEALGIEAVEVDPLGGGCIAAVYRVGLADGRSVVAKVAGADGTLDIEGFMLRFLAARRLPVPDVIFANPRLLVLTFIPGHSTFTTGAHRHAAELLASLHASTWSHFGLERDTLIGSLHQPNTPASAWIDFFRDHRLLAFAQAAHKEQRIDAALLARITRLADRLSDHLTEPPAPSLIHGDIWTTNVLAAGDRITAFLDPAIYHADPEIELAFITLFDTFGGDFFEAYHKLRPIRPGFFEVRRHIYNLYPLLVHVRLFGGGYIQSVSSTLDRLGF
jgi:fructosamine-3-kinase